MYRPLGRPTDWITKLQVSDLVCEPGVERAVIGPGVEHIYHVPFQAIPLSVCVCISPPNADLKSNIWTHNRHLRAMCNEIFLYWQMLYNHKHSSSQTSCSDQVPNFAVWRCQIFVCWNTLMIGDRVLQNCFWLLSVERIVKDVLCFIQTPSSGYQWIICWIKPVFNKHMD